MSNITTLGNYFWELKQEIEGSLEAIEERDQQETKVANPAPEPSSAKGNKGKKGGKKKPGETAKGSSKEESKPLQDLVDQLNTRPTLPAGWDILPPPALAITDEVRYPCFSEKNRNHC